MVNTWGRNDTGNDSTEFKTEEQLSGKESEVRETQSGYCTSYRTNDGGAGYSYTPFENGKNGVGRRLSAKNPRKWRIAIGSVLAVAFFGLCFLGGYAGAKLAGLNQSQRSGGLPAGFGTVPTIEGQEPKGTGEGSAVGGYTTEAEVISAVSDSVVLLTVEIAGQNSDGETPAPTVKQSCGIIFSSIGYIATYAHVIEGATKSTVILSDGTQLEATVVGYDTASDIAVLRVNPGDRELQAAEFGCSADLVAGEKVTIIGNPYGYGKLGTGGMISAVDVTCEVPFGDGRTMTLIPVASATDTAVFGGGMFNMDGKLVGFVNAHNKESGIGFAIPVDSAVEVINELCWYGYVRGVVDHGLSLVNVTEKDLNFCRYVFRIPEVEVGVYVLSSKYSEAIRFKDRIVSVEGTEITTSEEFGKIVSGFAVGDTLHLVVRRGGRNYEVELILHEYIPVGTDVSET